MDVTFVAGMQDYFVAVNFRISPEKHPTTSGAGAVLVTMAHCT
jgi:hypothetical protein